MVRRASWAVALLASILLALAGCGSTPPPPPDTLGTQLNWPIPPAIAGLPLIDQDGRVTSLAALHGKVVVLADSLTLCQETCPMTNANLVNMARATQAAGQGNDVVFVTATVDPERDTPQRLAAYRRLFAPAPTNWLTVTADPQTVATLWHYFGVYYERTPEDSPAGTDWLTGAPLTYDVAHADLIFFFDRDGHLRYGIDAAPNTQGHAPPGPLNSFLNDEGRENLHHPATDAWTPAQGLSVVAWLTGHTIPQRATLSGKPSTWTGASNVVIAAAGSAALMLGRAYHVAGLPDGGDGMTAKTLAAAAEQRASTTGSTPWPVVATQGVEQLSQQHV